MDSWEWNKIIGAVLGTLMFVLVLNIVIGALFEVPPPAKPGYVVQGVPAPTASQAPTTPVAEALPDWGTVLPTASVADGQKVAERCQQCHDFSKGGPNKIGPNLWSIVERARASHPGFDYSSAMASIHEPWTYDKLFTYLKLPAAMVPGTKMTFAGIASAPDRINLIAYLRTLADTPAPIAAPAPAKAATATPPTAPARVSPPAAGGATAAGATPAKATPASATPASATPASATPASATPASQAAQAPAAQTGPDIAHADVALGKDVSARCQPCHSLSKGGADMIGPNLWGIVTRARATAPGYSYSSAMSANHDPWTYAKLFDYLKQPQLAVPGTKMTFAGLANAKDRTDLIGYLRTLSDKPAPLPAAK